jgi:hypothetical protein
LMLLPLVSDPGTSGQAWNLRTIFAWFVQESILKEKKYGVKNLGRFNKNYSS